MAQHPSGKRPIEIPRAFPQRIVCLTEETTETLYLLGAGDLVAGISGYTVRPPEARSKPKVSAFINANYEKILDLRPDLVLTFSDLQADISRELIRRGVTVLAFNQRSVDEIFAMIETLARLVDARSRGQELVEELRTGLRRIESSAARVARRPRVFFEEWHDPLISGIRWVEELVEIAGGEPVFPALRQQAAATGRIVTPEQVVERDPEVVIASWCGVRVNKQRIAERPGWKKVTAVRHRHVYEVKSAFILQPGPAALTEGVRQIHAILCHASRVNPDPSLAPRELLDPDVCTE